MNCLDCAADGVERPADAICHDCGAGVCLEHLAITDHVLTVPGMMARPIPVDPPARTIRCLVCEAAHDAQHDRPAGRRVKQRAR